MAATTYALISALSSVVLGISDQYMALIVLGVLTRLGWVEPVGAAQFVAEPWFLISVAIACSNASQHAVLEVSHPRATASTGETARRLGVSGTLIRELIARGDLPATRTESGYYRLPIDVSLPARRCEGCGAPLDPLPRHRRFCEDCGRER